MLHMSVEKAADQFLLGQLPPGASGSLSREDIAAAAKRAREQQTRRQAERQARLPRLQSQSN